MSDPKIQAAKEVTYTSSTSPKGNPQTEAEEEVFEFEAEAGELTDRFQTDKKIKREVDGKPRDIRIGKKDGKKYRYTADTKEELVTKTTTGKNTYLTKTEFDRQVKEMLGVDTIPESIKPELRDGFIVFIDKETGLTMSAHELRANTDLIAAQKAKEAKGKMSEISLDFAENHGQIYQPQMPNIDEINIPTLPSGTEVAADTREIDESTFKIDPNWYTEEGVRSLEKEWGNLARKSKGFDHKFYQGVVAIAKEVMCDPDHLMSLINAESSFNPKHKTGLFGFVGITRDKYNFQPSKLTPNQQLPYIRKCLVEGKEMAYGENSNHALSPGELYSIIFVPGYLRGALKDPKHILVSKRSSNPQKRKFYNNPVNINLDKQKKGYITIADMAKRIEEKNAYNTCKSVNLAYNGDRHRPYSAPKADEMLLAQNDTRATAKPTPAPTPEPEITQAQLTAEELAALAENGVNFDSMPKNMLQEVVIIGDKNKAIAKRQQQGNTNI